jgi:cytochrome c biogenesis protein CcdA
MFELSGVPLGFALAAGLVAAVNPCGFALLPGYLGLLITQGEDGGTVTAMLRALRMTAAMTAGFVTVFGLFGLVVTPLALSVQQHLPWVTIVIGLALIGAGGWLLAGRELLLRLPHLRVGGRIGSTSWMYVYGVSYAVASLSCTIAPFLALTTSTFHTTSVLGGIAVFVAYALGMAVVVGVLAVAVALARGALVARARQVLPYVSRTSGALLIVAGGYVAYYGAYELRVFGGGAADDPIVDAATDVQGRIVSWLDRFGPGRTALVLAGLILVGAAAALVSRRRRAAGQAARRSDPEQVPRGT